MARIRTVKPDLFSDEKLARVSLQARLLYIGLFTEADDQGRLYASAKRLAGALFPHDQRVGAKQVGRWLSELEGIGRVIRYKAEGIEYLFLPNFARHQRISHPTPSRLPPPSGHPPELFGSDSGSNSGAPPETFGPSHAREEQGTGNREQGTGKHPTEPSPRPRSESGAPPEKPSPHTPRRREGIDALIVACGGDPRGATDSALRTAGVKFAAIRKAEAKRRSHEMAEDDPELLDEIRLRAKRYAQKYSGAALTPGALAAHWHELGDEVWTERSGPRSSEVYDHAMAISKGEV